MHFCTFVYWMSQVVDLRMIVVHWPSLNLRAGTCSVYVGRRTEASHADDIPLVNHTQNVALLLRGNLVFFSSGQPFEAEVAHRSILPASRGASAIKGRHLPRSSFALWPLRRLSSPPSSRLITLPRDTGRRAGTLPRHLNPRLMSLLNWRPGLTIPRGAVNSCPRSVMLSLSVDDDKAKPICSRNATLWQTSCPRAVYEANSGRQTRYGRLDYNDDVRKLWNVSAIRRMLDFVTCFLWFCGRTLKLCVENTWRF